MGTATVSGVFCWLSNDPIGIKGGLNQYVFCGDDPLNRIDPLGFDNMCIHFSNVVGGSYNNAVAPGISISGQVVGGGQLQGMITTLAIGSAAQATVIAGGYALVAVGSYAIAAYPALQNFYYSVMASQPASYIDPILYYPQAAPTYSTTAGLLAQYSPYANQFVSGLVTATGMGGPFASYPQSTAWLVGQGTAYVCDPDFNKPTCP